MSGACDRAILSVVWRKARPAKGAGLLGSLVKRKNGSLPTKKMLDFTKSGQL